MPGRDMSIAPVPHRPSDPGRGTGTVALRPAATPDLDDAVRRVFAPPRPGERYHLWGLSTLWAERLKEKSAATHRSYTRSVASWLDYCLRQHLAPLTARRADVDDWLAWSGPMSTSTFRVRRAALRSYYGYLISNDLDVHDPAAHVTAPAADTRATATRAHLDGEGLNRLLHAATTAADTAQDAARQADTDVAAGRAAADAAQRARHHAEVATRDAALLRLVALTAVRSGTVRGAPLAAVGENAGHEVFRYITKRGKTGPWCPTCAPCCSPPCGCGPRAWACRWPS
jgi:integrase/recombinase XerD